MKIKIFLFPSSVGLWAVKHYSPWLAELLDSLGLELQVEHWHGTLDSLPAKPEPVIIRASPLQKCSDKELIQRCKELGHLIFYGPIVLGHDEEQRESITIKWLQENEFVPEP